MNIRTFLAAIVLFSEAAGAIAGPGQGSAGTHQGLFFTLPAGWTTNSQEGRFVVAPANPPAGVAVFIIIHGREPLNRSLDDWLGARMAGDLGSSLAVLQSAPPTRARSGSLDVLSAGRTVQDQRGAVLLQIYYAVSDGRQAGLAMVATTHESALKTYMPDVQALFQSLRFAATPDGAPKSGSTLSARGSSKSAVTAADLVGRWEHTSSSYADYVSSTGGYAGSSIVAYGEAYTFAADGTFTYGLTGVSGRNYVKESDAGTWSVQGDRLMIQSKQRSSKTYYILSYQIASDGTSFMTLLDTYYPLFEGNIKLYSERYVRKGK
jgi:hypothetical protein